MFNYNTEPNKSIDQMAKLYAMQEISQDLGPMFKQAYSKMLRGVQYSIRSLGASLVSVGRKMEHVGRVPRSTAPLTE